MNKNSKRVKIKQSKMDTYWYAGKIGEEFWVVDGADGYYDDLFGSLNDSYIVEKGDNIPGVCYIDKADCVVLWPTACVTEHEQEAITAAYNEFIIAKTKLDAVLEQYGMANENS